MVVLLFLESHHEVLAVFGVIGFFSHLLLFLSRVLILFSLMDNKSHSNQNSVVLAES